MTIMKSHGGKFNIIMQSLGWHENCTKGRYRKREGIEKGDREGGRRGDSKIVINSPLCLLQGDC
jgi:hypothetical protein